MRFASSIVAASDSKEAIAGLLAPVEERVTPGMVDLAAIFATPHFDDDLPGIIDRLTSTFSTAVLIGCTAEGTIGVNQEIERMPSMSLLVGAMPGVRIHPFHLRQPQIETAVTSDDWERLVGVSAENKPVFVAMADPFSVALHELLEGINEIYPGSPLVGGVASAARQPRQNRLILNGEIHHEGLVGVALTGRIAVETIVSQGCRPIGTPFVITKGERNIIYELGGRPALERLHEVVVALPSDDEELARQSLFIGRVIDEYKGKFGRGDFLIHNIMGVDRKTGAIGIAGRARVGATVQFHVRDAKSADEDLRAMLGRKVRSDIRGAMLFGCNGRGTHMWPTPGHDARVFTELMGKIPMAGFFCGGEFGPVGGRNFVHGFTASIALLSDPVRSDEEDVPLDNDLI